MATIRLAGDWSAPLAFGLSGLGMMLASHFRDYAHLIPYEGPVGIGFLGLALVLALFAAMGRRVPDGAVFYYWKSLGTSLASVIFSALLLLFGVEFLLMNFSLLVSESYAKTAQMEFSFYLVFLGVGFFTFAYYFLLHARITVFNPDKSFLAMVGKPWSFTRRYHARDFQELRMHTGLSYAGQLGMIRHFQRHFYISAVGAKNNVLLMRDNSSQEAEINLKTIGRLTGLPIIIPVVEKSSDAPSGAGSSDRKISPLEILAGRSCTGPLGTLLQEYPQASVIERMPTEFLPSPGKLRPFEAEHFIALLKAAKVPYYFHTSTTIQTDIWFFKDPLIVALDHLSAFDEFAGAAAETPGDFVLFTDVVFPWKEFGWTPGRKYPPADADQDTIEWWGRQGKDEV